MTGQTHARRFLVRGRVQGVGFRWFVEREAQMLGIAGWVRNNADGAVEVFAQGIGAYSENFKRVSIQTGIRRGSKNIFAAKGYAAQLNDFFQGIQRGTPAAITVADLDRRRVAFGPFRAHRRDHRVRAANPDADTRSAILTHRGPAVLCRVLCYP